MAFNELIVKTVRKIVEASGLRFYTTHEVPRGDNGINVGQAFLGGGSTSRATSRGRT